MDGRFTIAGGRVVDDLADDGGTLGDGVRSGVYAGGVGVRDRGLVVSHHSAGAGDRGVDRFCKVQECGGGDPFGVVVCAADPVLCVDRGREFGLVHAEWGLGSVRELRSGEWKVGRFERGKKEEERRKRKEERGKRGGYDVFC